MRTNIFYLCTLLLVLISCNESGQNGFLHGKLEKCPDPTYLHLVEDESGKLVDSIKVVNGEFSYEFSIPYPKQFTLHNKRNQYEFRDRKTLWLEASDIELTGDFEFCLRKKLRVNFLP